MKDQGKDGPKLREVPDFRQGRWGHVGFLTIGESAEYAVFIPKIFLAVLPLMYYSSISLTVRKFRLKAAYVQCSSISIINALPRLAHMGKMQLFRWSDD